MEDLTSGRADFLPAGPTSQKGAGSFTRESSFLDGLGFVVVFVLVRVKALGWRKESQCGGFSKRQQKQRGFRLKEDGWWQVGVGESPGRSLVD